MKMGPWPYTASENLAADQGHHVLRYHINITAYTQQLLVWKICLEPQQIEQ